MLRVLVLFVSIFTYSALAQTKVVVIPLGGNEIRTCVDQDGRIECGTYSSFRVPVNRTFTCVFSGANVSKNIRYLDETTTNFSFFQNNGSVPRIEVLYQYDSSIFSGTDSSYRVSFNNGSNTDILTSAFFNSQCQIPQGAAAIATFTSPTGSKWKISADFDNSVAGKISFVDLLFERLP